RLRSSDAARRGADVGWPDCELAAGEGTHGRAVRAILETKIDVAVRAGDPFLHQEVWRGRQKPQAGRLRLRHRGGGVDGRKAARDVIGGFDGRLDDARVAQLA